MKGLEEKDETYWPMEAAAQLLEMKVSAKTVKRIRSGSMPLFSYHAELHRHQDEERASVS